MFISQISTENWQDTRNHGSIEKVNSWNEIKTAITELDGYRKTLVTLETDGETHMAIGGGAGKYLVYVTFDNENFSYLINSTNSDHPETLIVGGQEGIYPEKWCVDLSLTLRAAESFAKFGLIEKSVAWDRDEVPEAV